LIDLLVAFVVFLASFTQGVVGFGFGLVTMAFLPLVVPETFAIPFVAVYGTVVSVIIAWQLRAKLAWRHALPLIIGTAVGVPIGVLVVSAANPLHIKLVLGVVLIAYTLWALFFSNVKEVHVPDGWGYLAGASSGVLGAFNTGGPPVVVYTTLVRWEKDLTTSTLQVVFVLTGLIQLVGFGATGMLDGDVLTKNLLFAPAMVAGVLLGHLLYRRIDQVTFRRILLSVLLVVGVVYVQISTSQL
jgi:uncharacterized membrane protein YfcA